MPDKRAWRWAGWVCLAAMGWAALWWFIRPAPAAPEPAPERVATLTRTVAITAPPKQATAPLPLPTAVPATEPPALQIPVQGVPASALRDTFDEGRDNNGRAHEAIDILAPRGTPVLAVDEGPIVKLFLSKPGGITAYQFDSTGQFAYYYAHLDRYADGLAEGQHVQRGSVIGYVGFTGNASPDAPHLHFAIFRLGLQKQWWKGEPVNPFEYLGGKKP